jgi:hypothetical protein
MYLIDGSSAMRIRMAVFVDAPIPPVSHGWAVGEGGREGVAGNLHY